MILGMGGQSVSGGDDDDYAVFCPFLETDFVYP